MKNPMNRVARMLVLPVSMLAAALLLPNLGCDKDDKPATPNAAVSPAAKMAVAVIKPAGSAATQPTNKEVTGTVTFTPEKDGVKAVADLTGLTPGKHGIHIHENADMSDPGLKSAGGHWDPDGHKQHGGPMADGDKRHAGDLGNLEADANGKAHYEVMVSGVSIGGKNDIVGHSVVIHAGEDDLKSNPAGNSGGRVAGGAIEARK